MRIRAVVTVGLWGLGVGWGWAQSWSELRLQYELWQAALRVRARSEELYSRGLLSASELERVQTEALAAEMRFRMVLERWCSHPPLRLTDAALAPAGSEWQVRLTWVNEAPQPTSGPVAAMVWKDCAESDVRLVVRVLDDQGISIGFPPDQVLTPWRGPHAQTVTFRLWRPVGLVYIERQSLGERIREAVRLRVEGSAFRVESQTPAQVGSLGGEVLFLLRLRALVPQAGVCNLAVQGLPPGVVAEFTDPETNAILTAVEPTGERTLGLRVRLPETWPAGDLGRPLKLRAGCRQGDGLEPAVELELTPAGRPVLEVSAENYFGQARVGEAVYFDLTLRNSGYGEARGVRLEVEGPARWNLRWEPPPPWDVPAQAQQSVRLRMEMPTDTTPGEYTVRLRPVVPATEPPPNSVELRVRVLGRSGWLPVLAVGALVVVFGAAVGVIWRLMRRF